MSAAVRPGIVAALSLAMLALVAGSASAATPLTYRLTVLPRTTGTVTTSDGSIQCGRTCTSTYAAGRAVELTATPAPGFGFTGWTGSCTGTRPCVLTMTATKSVAATFAKARLTLLIVGSGTVTTPELACATRCTHEYPEGATVTLDVASTSADLFDHWGGSCTGAESCSVSMSRAKTVIAYFTSYPLRVTTIGNGSVRGRSIACGTTCSGRFLRGTVVTLTATPDTGATFAGWSGACTTTSRICSVRMNAVTEVTARFLLPQRSLAIVTAGSGGGTVGSEPPASSCTTPPVPVQVDANAFVEYSDGSIRMPNGQSPDANPARQTLLEQANEAAYQAGQLQNVTLNPDASITTQDGATRYPDGQWVDDTLDPRGHGHPGRPALLDDGSLRFPDIGLPPHQARGWTKLTNGAWVDATRSSSMILPDSSSIDLGNGNTFGPLPGSIAGSADPTTLAIDLVIAHGDTSTTTCTFDVDQLVTLTATPDATSNFAAWTACDTSDVASCTVTMNAARTIMGTFSAR